MVAPTDITGQRFGLLVAIEDAGSNGRRRLWRFRCDCGSEVIRIMDGCRRSAHASCGCFKPGWLNKGRAPASKTHGLSRTRLYRIWTNMLSRCERPSNHRFADYGGRGITVCADWHDSGSFLRWALANGYADDLQLDRIDNDGAYCPSNCRFVTPRQNTANMRNSVKYMVRGELLNLPEIERRYGVNQATLRHRIKKLGYSPDDALTANPPKGAAAIKRATRRKFLGIL